MDEKTLTRLICLGTAWILEHTVLPPALLKPPELPSSQHCSGKHPTE